jgi:hypothetical protein
VIVTVFQKYVAPKTVGMYSVSPIRAVFSDHYNFFDISTLTLPGNNKKYELPFQGVFTTVL